jgi:hypothetical protein
MFKKILLGSLLVGLIAVLVAGAVNRTNARTESSTTGGNGQRGHTTETARVGNESAAEQGQRGGRWAQTEQGAASGRGGLGQGNGQAAPNGGSTRLPAPQTNALPQGWLTAAGTVVSVASDLVEIETGGGAVIPFEGQPLSYALSQGLVLKLGDAVAVSGYEENGEFKIGQVTNLGSGASVTLRDASGRPGWAGAGRGRKQ